MGEPGAGRNGSEPGHRGAAARAAAFSVGSLLGGRTEFRAKGDRANPRLAAAVGAGGLLVGSLLAALLVTVTNHAPDGHRSTFAARWSYGIMRLVSPAPDAEGSRVDGIATAGWVDVAINVLSSLLLLAALYAAFRSRKAVDPLTADDAARLRVLLERQGERDSLGYFAPRREKSVVWPPTGNAAVAYRVMGASAAGGTVYARHGLDALELGDEAIVDAGEFTLEGRAMRTVRQARHRVARAGYAVGIRRHADIPTDELAELLRRADEIGITRVSLNFAMFRSVFERGSRLGAGPVLRLWRALLGFASRWWQFESLYRANAKYRPIREPRFLLFEKSGDLPRIGIASARAEGFLELPGLPWRPSRRSHLEPGGPHPTSGGPHLEPRRPHLESQR
ncbi:phosphatidylglycerol lysyltransferase domain-containing protein [Streptomyces sp. NPDC002851]